MSSTVREQKGTHTAKKETSIEHLLLVGCETTVTSLSTAMTELILELEVETVPKNRKYISVFSS